MSNLAIGKSATQKELSTAQTDSKNVNNQTNFGTIIDQQMSQTAIKKFSRSDVILPCDTILADSNAKGKMELAEGEIINLVNAHVFNVKPRTHEEDVNFLQKDLGISESEAEDLLKPSPIEPPSSLPSVEETRAFLKSNKIEAVVRDNITGVIVAKIYKTESGILPPEAEEILRRYEKDSNVTITHYKNFTDFDMLPEETVLAEKDYVNRPEVYAGIQDVLEQIRTRNRQILAG